MSDEATPNAENSGSARRKILFAVLGILLVALAYDYAVARPSVNTAYDKIVERSQEVNADSTQIFTNQDVRKLVGKQPSRTFQDDNGDTVEVFSWRSGLPIKTHDLYAVYKSNGGNLLFYRHAKFKYETSGEVSQFSVPIVIQNDGADMEGFDPSQQYADSGDEMAGGGGPGGGGPGGGGPGGGGPGGGGPGGGGGFDPEARFAEQDADGDGVWKDDEIPERARENMAEIDTDGDGAVSKDEWMARVEAMRARFGGRGGGDEAGARQRPALEDESADDSGDAQPDSAAEESAEQDPPAEEQTPPEGAESEEADPSESDK